MEQADLVQNLDLPEEEEFSLRFLRQERFRWVLTPSTKQRYLQSRVEQLGRQEAEERASARSEQPGAPAQPTADSPSVPTSVRGNAQAKEANQREADAKLAKAKKQKAHLKKFQKEYAAGLVRLATRPTVCPTCVT